MFSNSQTRELILDGFSGKKKQFFAHREFVSSLKWMWFEWDPESLTRPKAYIVVTWDSSKLAIFNLEVAVNRRPSWQTVGTLPPMWNKLVMGHVVADVNSSWSFWEPVWAQWPSERGCVPVCLESWFPSPWMTVKLFLMAEVNRESKIHSYKVETPAKQLFWRCFCHSYR